MLKHKNQNIALHSFANAKQIVRAPMVRFLRGKNLWGTVHGA